MKISIMTTALSENYGALLQTYALQRAIEKLGHEVFIYDYIDRRRITYGMSFKKRVIHCVWNKIRMILSFGEKKRNFETFRKDKIKFTPLSYHNSDELKKNPGNFDLYVSGSDQIWNPEVFQYDYSYFLDFITDGRKISYGSSYGRARFSNEQRLRCESLLKDFEAISVRESSGVAITKGLFGIDSQVVLDPTLLLSKEEWLDILPKERIVKDKFILCYFMPGDRLVNDAIESIAQELSKNYGLRIIRLGIKEYKVIKYGYKDCDICAGPYEFLQYFRDSEYVITNSFHGAAFSINFSKKAFLPINMNINDENCLHDRITSLVKLLNAENMIVPIYGERLERFTDNSENSDFESVQRILLSERCKSIQYLENSIRGTAYDRS